MNTAESRYVMALTIELTMLRPYTKLIFTWSRIGKYELFLSNVPKLNP